MRGTDRTIPPPSRQHTDRTRSHHPVLGSSLEIPSDLVPLDHFPDLCLRMMKPTRRAWTTSPLDGSLTTASEQQQDAVGSDVDLLQKKHNRLVSYWEVE